MQAYILYLIISFVMNLPKDNPAVLDIVKVFVGSIAWIGGLVLFLYLRERKLKKLKVAVANK